MSSYYVNIDSRYRDLERYPNPCDFGITFKQSTGPIQVEGRPLNWESLYETASIDPDFLDANLRLTGCKLDNIKITDTAVYLSGITPISDPEAPYIDIIYDNQIIYTFEKIYVNSPFLVKLNRSNLQFEWRLFVAPASIDVNYNNTTRSIFKLTQTNKIYFAFDFDMPTATIIVQKSTGYYPLFYIENPGPFDTNSIIPEVLNTSICITAFNSDATPSTYQGRTWGFHVLSSNFDLKSTREPGEFNFEIDNSENIYVSSNVNPFTTNPLYTEVLGIPQSNIGPHGHFEYEPGKFISTSNNVNWFTRYYSSTFENNFTGPVYTFTKYSQTGYFTEQVYGFDLPQGYCLQDDVYVNFNNVLYNFAGFYNTDFPSQISVFSVDTSGYFFNYICDTQELFTTVVSFDAIVSGNYIYLFVRDGTNAIYAYRFDGQTISKVSQSSINSQENGENLRVFELDDYIIIVSPDIKLNSFDNQQCHVVKFDKNTGSLIDYGSFETESKNQYVSILKQTQNEALVFLSGELSPNIQIVKFEYTNDLVFTVLNPLTCFASSIPVAKRITIANNTHDYLAVGDFYNTSVQWYIIDDPNNPIKIGDIYKNAGKLRLITENGEMLCTERPDQAYGFTNRRLALSPSFLTQGVIRSSHYNWNNQFLLQLGADPLRVQKFTGTNGSQYGALISQFAIFFFKTDDIRAVTINGYKDISDMPVTSVTELQIITLNNVNYMIFNDISKIYFFKLIQVGDNIVDCQLIFSQEIASIPDKPIDLNDYNTQVSLDSIVNILPYNYYDIQYVLITTYCNLAYRYRINSDDTVELLHSNISITDKLYSNSSVITYYPNLDNYLMFAFSSDLENPTSENINSQALNVINLTSENLDYFDTDQILFISGPKYDSCILYKDANNNPYIFTYANGTPGIAIYDITNPRNISVISSRFSQDINNFNSVAIFLNDALDNRIYAFINRNTNDNIADYIECYDITDPYNPVNVWYDSVQVNDNQGAISSCKQLLVTNKNNGRYFLLSSNDDLTAYIYDVTNIEFAKKYQHQTKVSSDVESFYSCGSSFITRINSDGNTVWTNILNSEFSDTIGEFININNLVIDSTGLNIYACAGFKKRIQAKSSYIVNYDIIPSSGIYSSVVLKCSSITGEWTLAVPIAGDTIDRIIKIHYDTVNDRIIFSGDTQSNVMIIYNPMQQSETIPITPQVVLPNNVNTMGFIVCLLVDGTFAFYNTMFSISENDSMYMRDLHIDENYVYVYGETNSKTLKVGGSDQIIYNNLMDNQNAIVIYKFGLDGMFISNVNCILPQYSKVSLTDIKMYSKFNRVFSIINIINYVPQNFIEFYNTDGTLSKKYALEIGKQGMYSLIAAYYYDNLKSDSYGVKYSRVFMKNLPNYLGQTNPDFRNYNLYLMGNINDSNMNQSFIVRNNYYENMEGSFLGSTIKYVYELNGKIPLDKIIKVTQNINNIEDSKYYWIANLSPSPLLSIGKIEISGNSNGIYITPYSPYDISLTVFLLLQTEKIVPLYNGYINTDGRYHYDCNLNELSDVGEFVYICKENITHLYTLQFFPGSILTDVYYLMNLEVLTMPNRPIKNPSGGKSLTFNNIPYIMIAIWSTNSEGNVDDQIVNIRYDNNPLKDSRALYQIPVSDMGEYSNFYTIGGSGPAKIKFVSNFDQLRIRMTDHVGRILMFDSSPYKSIDSEYTSGVVPFDLMNINLRISFSKV